jgi:hypothetical protein
VLGADQAHAFALSATLNKIKGIDNLTNNNYLSWSKQVKGALGIIFFDQYLLDTNFEDFTVGNKINDINKRCILKFLFSQMDETNGTRFQAAILDIEMPLVCEMIPPTDEELNQNPDAESSPGDLVPSSIRGPGHLWKLVKEFHQSDNEANLYLIQARIEKFQQDYKTPLSTHLDGFAQLKNEFLRRGGHIDESHLGRRLLHSLHSSHTNKVRHILRTIKPITSRAVVTTLKQYKDENDEFKFSSTGKLSDGINNLKLAGNTSRQPNPPRQKCTPNHCVGPHQAEKCFKRPENAKAEREWFEKRGLNPPGRHLNNANNTSANPGQTDQERPSETNTPAGVANNVNSIVAPKKKIYVFVAFGNEVNLVHPTFEAIWDSGASSHMFNNYAFFKNVKNTSLPHDAIMTAGSEELKVEACGKVVIKGVTIKKFTLRNSLYIPTLRNNLIAAGALKQKGAIKVAHPSDPLKFIIAFDDKTFLRGRYVNNLMVVTIEPVSNLPSNTPKIELKTDNLASHTDHNRLGHINPIYLSKTTGGKEKDVGICDTC